MSDSVGNVKGPGKIGAQQAAPVQLDVGTLEMFDDPDSGVGFAFAPDNKTTSKQLAQRMIQLSGKQPQDALRIEDNPTNVEATAQHVSEQFGMEDSNSPIPSKAGQREFSLKAMVATCKGFAQAHAARADAQLMGGGTGQATGQSANSFTKGTPIPAGTSAEPQAVMSEADKEKVMAQLAALQQK
jgi:hypothetical protein